MSDAELIMFLRENLSVEQLKLLLEVIKAIQAEPETDQ